MNCNNQETIHFILTGGTIDSSFDPTKDSLVIGDKSHIENFVTNLNLHNSTKFEIAVLKDSREIRHTDRQKILEMIKNSAHKMFIITHGTYTMPDTAQYLIDELEASDKVVVLTGSMIPLKGFEFSDGGFNLGYALAKVQCLSPGVYICMNGRVFDPYKVDKNRMKGRFEEVQP